MLTAVNIVEHNASCLWRLSASFQGALVWSWTSQCEICVGQSGIGRDFPL